MTDPIQAINQTLARCQCGSKAIMCYIPGCTYIVCIREGKTVAAIDDYQPVKLAEKWNRKFLEKKSCGESSGE